MRAEASDGERPCVMEVDSFCAVSWADSNEYPDVIDEGVAPRF